MESIAEKLRLKSDFRFLELETRVRRGSKGFESMVNALAENKTVRYIYLCGEFFDSLDGEQRKLLFGAVGKLESLRSVYVANAKLSNYSVLDLADMFLAQSEKGSLEEVSFQHLHIPNGVALDPMVKALARLPSVSKVEIGVLFMNHNQAAFNAESLSELFRSKSLCSLTLIDLRLDESHYLAMSKDLQTNQSLKELQLWGESLSRCHCLALASMLEINTGLRSLSIFFGSIDNIGLEAVATAIGQRSTIQSLSIENEDYSVSKAGVFSLIRMLERNKKLESFSLATKALDDSGCMGLCRAIERHPSLKQLSLDNVVEIEDGWDDVGTNGRKDSIIGGSGLAALSAMLKVNKTIERLDLTGLSVDHVGARNLSSALIENTTLRELSLGFMKYEKAEAEADREAKRQIFWSSLEHLLEHNHTIERVTAEDCDYFGDRREKIDLLASLNRQKLRVFFMVDVDKTRSQFIDTLGAHSHNLDVLFYLLAMNPALIT
jgi:hypothetical protein